VKIKTKTKIIDNIIITKTISKPKPYQNQNHQNQNHIKTKTIKTKTISKTKTTKTKTKSKPKLIVLKFWFWCMPTANCTRASSKVDFIKKRPPKSVYFILRKHSLEILI
jgi:hypothetical protein